MTVYDYDQLRPSDVMIVVASAQIGVNVLNLPKVITGIMQSSDGWLAILIGGIVMSLTGWVIGRVIHLNPGDSLLAISMRLLGKWTTRIIFMSFAAVVLVYFSVIIRITGLLAKLYFLELTPIEVIILAFTLMIVYCVAGLRIAIMRINLLFLPIIIGFLIILLLFNLGHMSWGNLEPFFMTSWNSFVLGTAASLPSYSGIIVILFYGFLVKNSSAIPRMVMLGTSLVVVVYVLIFIFTVGVLGLHTTMNTLFPTIEMAKEAEVPGGFFERLHSIFFAVWMMAIFTSAVFGLDIPTMIMESIFRKVSKMTWILCLAPIGYFLSMIPRNEYEVLTWNTWAAVSMFTFSFTLPVILLIANKLKEKQPHG